MRLARPKNWMTNEPITAYDAVTALLCPDLLGVRVTLPAHEDIHAIPVTVTQRLKDGCWWVRTPHSSYLSISGISIRRAMGFWCCLRRM